MLARSERGLLLAQYFITIDVSRNGYMGCSITLPESLLEGAEYFMPESLLEGVIEGAEYFIARIITRRSYRRSRVFHCQNHY